MAPSEELTAKHVGGRRFNLLLTSPPYADHERYVDQPTQSWARYMKGGIAKNRVSNWLSGYLFRTLYKAWKRLDHGAIMAINIGEVVRMKGAHIATKICMLMVEFLQKLGMEYKGCLPLTMGPKKEPIWILQKNKSSELFAGFLFRSSNQTTVEDLTRLWTKFGNLTEEDQQWIGSFFLPKFWNIVRKSFTRDEICEALSISEEEYTIYMQRHEPVREYTVLTAN
jgi:hypothetical protein